MKEKGFLLRLSEQELRDIKLYSAISGKTMINVIRDLLYSEKTLNDIKIDASIRYSNTK